MGLVKIPKGSSHANEKMIGLPLSMVIKSDFIVIGGGIAGLSFALKAARLGTVNIIIKSSIEDGATPWAQGGIAAVFSEKDSFESHIQDTLIAGDGLCNKRIVELTVKEGPAQVRELISLGVPFSKKNAHSELSADPFPYDLTKEGGHNERRILHADDFTGKAISRTLIDLVKADNNIKIFEHHVAIDLITNHSIQKKDFENKRKCLGVYALDGSKPHVKNKGQIHTFAAETTVLATGGAGKVYLYTSNPDIASGDGIAMAYRAGARVSNLEFMQFHPTCLYSNKEKTFLISEALRGEGGELINSEGVAFMKGHHPMGSLAPRDIVARAIDAEIKRTGASCVYLDMREVCYKIGKENVIERFPNIYKKCLDSGIDFTKEPIPVVPAAHYTCGGVVTGASGETSIENLYAIGEVASTGLHGANRLASNSLLEAVVFSELALRSIEEKIQKGLLQKNRAIPPLPLPEWDSGKAVPMEDRIDINHTWKEIRTLMWNYVGIVRTNGRLAKAKERLDMINHEVDRYYWSFLLDRDLIELRNLLCVANLMVQCAILRKESRGLHYNLDYPFRDDGHFFRDTVL